MASGPKKLAGVIGWPVAHSLSPRLHNFWLKKYNIEGEYKAVAAKPEELTDVIKKLVAEEWMGFNLTIPHKETMMPLLNEIEESARLVGAVNTVIIKNGKLTGLNTDTYGFWGNIRKQVQQKNKAVILGAGGAARAVVEALHATGFNQIVIANRNLQRAESLCKDRPHISVSQWNDRSSILNAADLLVNATSLGMTGKEPLEIDLSLLPKTALVTDIVYSPLITPLLAQAQGRGNSVADGLGMLLYQAVPAFEAWFGVRPEVTDELRQYMLSD